MKIIFLTTLKQLFNTLEYQLYFLTIDQCRIGVKYRMIGQNGIGLNYILTSKGKLLQIKKNL